jgi:hypothetical protein
LAHVSITNSEARSIQLSVTITPCSRLVLEQVTVAQLVKKFLTFYGNRRFIAMSIGSTSGPNPKPRELSLHSGQRYSYSPYKAISAHPGGLCGQTDSPVNTAGNDVFCKPDRIYILT